MKKKIVIFDFDGTIWDTVDIVVKNNLDKINPKYHSREIVDKIYENNVNIFFNIMISKRDKGESDFVVDEENLKKAEELNIERKKDSLPIKGIEDLLISLKNKNILLSIMSMTSEASTMPIIVKNNFQDLFCDIVFGDNDRNKHSKMENIEFILQKNGLSLDEAVFISDTLGDIREANAIGIDTIAVTYGLHARKYFEREKNENIIAIVDSVDELKNKLEDITN